MSPYPLRRAWILSSLLKKLFLLTTSFFVASLRMTLKLTLINVILSEAKDPYDEAFEAIEPQGFFAPVGAQNDIHPSYTY